MRQYFDRAFTAALNYLTRKRFLYKTIGFLAFMALLGEFAIVNLPEAVLPNYAEIEANHGYWISLLLGWIIEKYASGLNEIAVVIECTMVLVCLIIDYKINKIEPGHKSIWNFFFGFIQNINQNYE
jgi:hypothetical protein